MHLGFFRLIKLFFLSLFLQTSWSFYSMQSLGFFVTLFSSLDEEKKKLLLQNRRLFFNTHPYMAGFIIGAVLRALENDGDGEDIKKHITVSQSAFAAYGDMFFWQTLRPGLSILGVIIGLKYGIWGPILFLGIYNIIHLFFRFYGFIAGYQKGWDVVFMLKARAFSILQRAYEALGAFLIGLLPVVLPRNYHTLCIIPVGGIFLILLWKKVAPILILTFVFILIIINLILI
ncbi:MAG: PTS system mannose/fructose/sorbose family transporter subunit IID [candidate division WOR-3 bacterium]